MEYDINKFGVYKIIFPSGEFYLGAPIIKKGILGIWNKYKNNHPSSPKYLQNIAEKYGGWLNPKIIFVILENTETKEDALLLEIKYISKFWTDEYKDPLLLNRNRFVIKQPDISGENNPTKRPEVRKILSERMLGENNPTKRADVKEKTSKRMKGKKLSEEHKKKISNSVKGKTLGRKHTEETKIKISKSRRSKSSYNFGLETPNKTKK
jgi:hypothetical protein